MEIEMTTVAKVMAETLKELGVKYIFGVPSGNWIDYLAAIQETEGLEFILVSNESAGGFMADVCWRLTGTIAACFGTFGPGACNLSTGVCGGYLDRSPMIAFTDEMNDEMRPRITQMNIDHQTLFKPITKWTGRLAPGKVKEIINKAAHLSLSDVPGPVHIGLPAGIAAKESVAEKTVPPIPTRVQPAASTVLEQMADLFIRSRKPVVVLGIGSMRFDIRNLVIDILEKFSIPAVLTPMAKGMVPEDHPCYAGVLAHALGDQVGLIHQQADLVIGIGYDPVELNYEDWMPDVPLLHIDTISADLDKTNFTLGCDAVGHLKTSLEHLVSLDCEEKVWSLHELIDRKEKMFAQLSAPQGSFDSRKVLDGLREILPEDGIMTCDVGAHLHLIGQHWKTGSPECQLMTNGGSSMGFAIPAAIAAKLSCPEREICCVVGDGGFYMMVGEMATARRLGLKIVFVVIMDAHLSLIRIKQERKDYNRYGTQLQSTAVDYESSPSIFGVPVFPAKNNQQYDRALKEAFSSEGPAVIEVFVSTDAYDDLILKGNK
ncbi:MAG: thiamine pyrophosphate-binding protein [Deltaproteobacteria bacterium]|nr:thiamine pyrophosphate-binding protein [Deltaproteobacteria bacterium]MBT7710725.1 thiamine pyrophosphate-binding protein [Deltaproteobacteria bacterium]